MSAYQVSALASLVPASRLGLLLAFLVAELQVKKLFDRCCVTIILACLSGLGVAQDPSLLTRMAATTVPVSGSSLMTYAIVGLTKCVITAACYRLADIVIAKIYVYLGI